MSNDRKREDSTRPSATGVRYFKLYERMTSTAADTGILAYPCKFGYVSTLGYEDWTADLDATKERVYPSVVSVSGEAGDFVACIFQPRSRHWEVIYRVEDWGWARLSGDLDPLSSVTARIWIDSASSNTMVDTTVDITVHDRLLATGGDPLAELTRIRWVYNPRTAKRYVVEAACDPDTSSVVWGE